MLQNFGNSLARWEDFLVREVDLSGKVCKLSSLVPSETSNGDSVSCYLSLIFQQSVVKSASSYIIPIEIDEVLKEIDRETMFEASFPVRFFTFS